LISLEFDGAIEYCVSVLAHFASIAAWLPFQSEDAILDDPVVFAAQRARGELPERTVWARELLPAQFAEVFFAWRLDFALQEERAQHRTPENRPLLIITIVHV
jgi:hypothetical protein